MGAYESGQAFLAGVFAKLPAEQRAQVEAAFNAPEAKDAVIVLGDGTLARSEFSRRMDEVKRAEADAQALYDANQAWFAANKPVIDEYQQIKPEYDRLKAHSGQPPVVPPAAPPAGPTFDRAAIEKLVQEQISAAAADVVGVSAWTSQRAVEHYRQFNEVLPVSEIVSATLAARQKGSSATLDDTYREKYGEKIAAAAKQAEDTRIEQLVQQRLQQERSAGNLPFPVRTEASPLDVLGKTPDASAYGVDAAVAEYMRLQQARA